MGLTVCRDGGGGKGVRGGGGGGGITSSDKKANGRGMILGKLTGGKIKGCVYRKKKKKVSWSEG